MSQGEPLFADAAFKNVAIGFIQECLVNPVKPAAYPFQEYGLLTSNVVRESADPTEKGNSAGNANANANANAKGPSIGSGNNTASQVATYKASIALEKQFLTSQQGESYKLALACKWRQTSTKAYDSAGVFDQPYCQVGTGSGAGEIMHYENSSWLSNKCLDYDAKTFENI